MPTRPRYDNEPAIAYGWIMLLTFLFIAVMIYLAIGSVENQFLDPINTMINKGTISTQTKNAIEWQRNMTMTLPVLALIGAFVWSVIRGVGGRGDSYGGATYQSFHSGYTMLVLCCLVGFIMSFVGGVFIDTLYTGLDKRGLIQGDDMPEDWKIVQADTMWWPINGYFTLCFLTPLLGLFLFIQSIVRKTYGNRMATY
jgi:hypothetical protein